jgi:hypothetical protein
MIPGTWRTYDPLPPVPHLLDGIGGWIGCVLGDTHTSELFEYVYRITAVTKKSIGWLVFCLCCAV